MKKLELIFVPLPAMGHLVPVAEFTKLLVGRDDRFSITLIILKELSMHPAVPKYIHSVSASFSGPIRFLYLPQEDSDSFSNSNPSSSSSSITHDLMERQKSLVRDAVHQLIQSDLSRLAGIVVDMWLVFMMDIADEMGVPFYAFFTSSAASLALMFHFQALHDQPGKNLAELADSNTKLAIPGLANLVPIRVLPGSFVSKESEGSTIFLNTTRKLRDVKGILVNTFMELESHPVNSLANGTTPPMYTVGPLLNLNHPDHHHDCDVIRWLDEQPSSSVVFLCFGTAGGFGEDQIKNIAGGLEKTGYRFLWTLRRPPPGTAPGTSSEYRDINEVLPEGFIDRTSEMGKVISWAPQMGVLAHPAIGGFVSHCGWNSILESIWNGVPIATWPLYAEQHFNAFQIVEELKLGVEIKLDYRKGSKDLVTAEEIESRKRSLMSDDDSEIRERRMRMREKSNGALMDGGSSSSNMQRLIGDMVANFSACLNINS